MPCPSLTELPPPPPGKSGWPWTEQTPPASRRDWPRITVVTPTFNQGPFIEETIRSVLLQGHPNLEYIIMDGGSTDQTVDIIKKYERWLAYWVSEKDRGQAHAINKGWARATGDILAWINSDDWYLPGALQTVSEHFFTKPQSMWIAGVVENSHSPKNVLKHFLPRPTSLTQCLGRSNYGFHQPGMFWRRNLVEAVGPLDETLHFCFDHDFFIRTLQRQVEQECLPAHLAGFRLHPDSKSCSRLPRFLKEDWLVFERYEHALSPVEAAKARRWLSEYEAESWLTFTYHLLANHQRWEALRHLFSKLPVLSHLKPPRLMLGAFYRTLISGKPPAWFHS